MSLVRRSQPQPLAVSINTANSKLIERFETHLLVRDFSPLSIRSYISACRKFAKFIGDKPFFAVTRGDVLAYRILSDQQKLSRSSIAHQHFILCTLGDFLCLGTRGFGNPFRKVPAPKVAKRLPNPLSEDEIEQIIAEAEKDTPRNLAIIELFYACGLRCQELANLRCEHLALDAGTLIVRQGKGRKDRIAPIGRKAIAALRAYLADRQIGPVFVPEALRQRGGIFQDRYGTWFGQWREAARNGKRVMRTVRLGDYELPTRERARLALDAYLADKLPRQANVIPEKALTKRAIARIITKISLRAGVTGVHPHRFRTSFATHLLNRGVNERVLMDLLGHTSLVATQRYLGLKTADLIAAHAKFHPREAM